MSGCRNSTLLATDKTHHIQGIEIILENDKRAVLVTYKSKPADNIRFLSKTSKSQDDMSQKKVAACLD